MLPIQLPITNYTYLVGSVFKLTRGVVTNPLVNGVTEKSYGKTRVKGCGMGTLFLLVSPCFRENLVVTCKIGSFLCSLDNLLQKNVIVLFFLFSFFFCVCLFLFLFLFLFCFVFFFLKSNFKMALIWKKGYFWPTFHIFSHQGKVTKIPSAHISLTYVHVFCSPYWLFLP